MHTVAEFVFVFKPVMLVLTGIAVCTAAAVLTVKTTNLEKPGMFT